MRTRRDVLKRFLVAAPLLSAGGSALLAGCGGGGSDTPTTRTLETANTRQRGTYGPLAFTLDMPKLDYAIDETIAWTFTVQNVSDKPVELRIITPKFRYLFGLKGGDSDFYTYSDAESFDQEETVPLNPAKMLTKTSRLIPAEIPTAIRSGHYGVGTMKIVAWLNITQIDGENVPFRPYRMTSTPDVPLLSIVYMEQDVNIL